MIIEVQIKRIYFVAQFIIFLWALGYSFYDCEKLVFESQIECEISSDVVIIFDGSSRISEEDFPTFINEIADGLFSLVPTDSNLGVVQYGGGSNDKIEFNLGELSPDEYQDAIRKINQIGGENPILPSVLDLVYEEMFNSDKSLSPEKHLMLIVEGDVIFFFFLKKENLNCFICVYML